MASFAEKLANVVSRHDEISALLSSPDVGADDLVRMNKELAALTPVVEAKNEYNKNINGKNCLQKKEGVVLNNT